jgi:hypothetical protein
MRCRLTLFVFVLFPVSCVSCSIPRSVSHSQILLGVCPKLSGTVPISPDVKILVESVAPTADVIRGFWVIYSYPPDPGYRVNIQVSSKIWVEILPKKQTSRFLVMSRGLVGDEPGTILRRLQDAESPRSPDDVILESFVPDARGRPTLWRVNDKGGWGEWKNGTVMNEFK